MRNLLYGIALGVAALGGVSTSVQAATNIIPGGWSVISSNGSQGVLRAGSPWGPGSAPSSHLNVVDGVFRPEGTQWNNGSFWWDQDASVNPAQVFLEIFLNQVYTIDRFVVQADDNDSYLIEYWDGAAWLSAYAIPTQPSFGLVTRDSGALAPISTNRLRFSATGGDNYYALSELQAFQAVPEPATWMMMIGGFALVGAAMRRRRRQPALA